MDNDIFESFDPGQINAEEFIQALMAQLFKDQGHTVVVSQLQADGKEESVYAVLEINLQALLTEEQFQAMTEAARTGEDGNDSGESDYNPVLD